MIIRLFDFIFFYSFYDFYAIFFLLFFSFCVQLAFYFLFLKNMSKSVLGFFFWVFSKFFFFFFWGGVIGFLFFS